MILDELEAPIVLAPLGGGPSTPELAAAVSNAGGLGFVAGSYLGREQLAELIAATRSLTDRPFGVNLFAPVQGPAAEEDYAPYVERLRAWAESRGFEPGEPSFSDDRFEEKVELLQEERPAVVSFAFGCPDRSVLDGVRAGGSEVWVTVTAPDEAAAAIAAGADALVVQGAEAGGHRGSFADGDEQPAIGLLPLLQLIAAGHDIPLVATGGVATGAGVAAAICAGASAVQMGSAFMLCPEAGTVEAHRRALRGTTPTTLTRAFTGRTGRGIRNAFIDEHDEHAPVAYPEIHYVTAPMRKAARAAGDDSAFNLWAGEAYPLARELPAGDVVRELMREAAEASAAVAARLARGDG